MDICCFLLLCFLSCSKKTSKSTNLFCQNYVVLFKIFILQIYIGNSVFFKSKCVFYQSFEFISYLYPHFSLNVWAEVRNMFSNKTLYFYKTRNRCIKEPPLYQRGLSPQIIYSLKLFNLKYIYINKYIIYCLFSSSYIFPIILYKYSKHI